MGPGGQSLGGLLCGQLGRGDPHHPPPSKRPKNLHPRASGGPPHLRKTQPVFGTNNFVAVAPSPHVYCCTVLALWSRRFIGLSHRGVQGLFLFLFFFFLFFLGRYLQHMEVSRLGIRASIRAADIRLVSELQLPAMTTKDQNHVCDLYHSSRQHWILNPLSEARDRTQILMGTGWVRYH